MTAKKKRSNGGPERTCIGCRSKRPAIDLARFTLDAEGLVSEGRSAPGRGAWLCRDLACLEKATKKKAFDRAFRKTLGPEAINNLRF